MIGQATMRTTGLVDALPARFDQCYAQHRDQVYRLCLRYGAGRPCFAEDITQEVFLRLFQSFAKVDQQQPVFAWLYTVATRLCISRLRRDRSILRRLARLVHGGAEGAPSAAQIFENHEQAAAVMRAMDRLPPRERVALCMKAIDGKSQKEIARILRVSEGYVSQLISRAREALIGMGWEDVDDGA
jgi:RNA polymerase sigma factor (sigma-70 family)